MFQTKKPDPDWLARIRVRGFTADSIFPIPEMEALKRTLLAHGGHGVVLAHPEPHYAQIMARGKIEGGSTAIFKRGTTSACHDNAFRLWQSNPNGVRLCTGWALSDDGLWRQHSWAKGESGRIIETTVSRVAYYGVDLTREESDTFFAN